MFQLTVVVSGRGELQVGLVVNQVVGYYVTIGSVQVVVFFYVAARLCTGDGPIAELVGTAKSFLC